MKKLVHVLRDYNLAIFWFCS